MDGFYVAYMGVNEAQVLQTAGFLCARESAKAL
jgi:hypothetical protein